MNNILTIIIPVYNTEQYIDRCINSILNQTEKRIEIIIINDDSTDSSEKRIQKYATNSNVKIVNNKKNIGQGNCRNIGLSMVNTKYFCFLDSDDWVDSNAYKESIINLEKNQNCDIALFGIKTEYENSNQSIMRYDYNDNIIDNNFALSILSREYAQDIYISVLLGNKVFRSSKFLGLLSFDNVNYEDIMFTYKAMVLSKKLILQSNIYLHYYQRQNSIMHSFSKNYIDDLFFVFQDLRKYLKSIDKYNVKQYYSFFEKCCTSMFDSMFFSTQKLEEQKKYIKYFISKLNEYEMLYDIIDYLDINRFKKMLFL